MTSKPSSTGITWIVIRNMVSDRWSSKWRKTHDYRDSEMYSLAPHKTMWPCSDENQHMCYVGQDKLKPLTIPTWCMLMLQLYTWLYHHQSKQTWNCSDLQAVVGVYIWTESLVCGHSSQRFKIFAQTQPRFPSNLTLFQPTWPSSDVGPYRE